MPAIYILLCAYLKVNSNSWKSGRYVTLWHMVASPQWETGSSSCHPDLTHHKPHPLCPFPTIRGNVRTELPQHKRLRFRSKLVLTHTLTVATHTHTHTHTQTHTFSLSVTHTHAHTHFLSLCHTNIHCYTNTTHAFAHINTHADVWEVRLPLCCPDVLTHPPETL